MLNLKEERKKLGLTQKQLAYQLKVHWVTYINWEKGHKTPDIESLAKLYKFFDIVPKYKIDLTKTFGENVRLKLEKIPTPIGSFALHKGAVQDFIEGKTYQSTSFVTKVVMTWLFKAHLSEMQINIIYFIKKMLDEQQINLQQAEGMVCLLLKKDDLNVV